MNEFNCYWNELPEEYKTKSALKRMGIYETGPVVATIKPLKDSDIRYELYSIKTAIDLLDEDFPVINYATKNNYLIATISLWGSYVNEICLMDLDGKIRFHKNDLRKTNKEDFDEIWRKELKTLVSEYIWLIPGAEGGKEFRNLLQLKKIKLEASFNYLYTTWIRSSEEEPKKHFFFQKKEQKTIPIRKLRLECYEALEMIYPKAALYEMRGNAQKLFKTYLENLHDNPSGQKGYQWLTKQLGKERIVWHWLSYQECEIIIKKITPLTRRSLGGNRK